MLFSIVASRAQRYTPLRGCPFSAMRKLFKPLVGSLPQYPGKGRLRCLANASQVKRLRVLVGATNERLDRLERSMLTASGRTRSSPVRSDEKGRRWRPFSGVWAPVPIKRFVGVYIRLPACHDCFEWDLGFPYCVKTAPA